MSLRYPPLRPCARPRPSLWLLAGSLVFLSLSALAPAGAGQDAPREYWIGMYLGTRKVGHTHYRVVPVTYRGQPAIETRSRSVVRITLLGTRVEQNSSQITLSDLRGQPITQTFDIVSNGSALKVQADYDYARKEIRCRIGEGAEATVRRIPIPPDVSLVGDTTLHGAGRSPVVGRKTTVHYLEPLTLQLQRSEQEVVGRATVLDLVRGAEVPALVVRSDTPQGRMITYEGMEGAPLRARIALGAVSLVMALEPRERALDMRAPAPPMPAGDREEAGPAPPVDFAVATAAPADRPIRDPRRVRRLTVVIDGVPDQVRLIADGRQRATALPSRDPRDGTDGSASRVRYEVRVPQIAVRARLPITDHALAAYRKPAPLLECDDPDIQRAAREICGVETDAYRAAQTLCAWVARNMTPDATIGVPRPAREIYRRRRGVCRDYATLYAALARAAGIPTRLCAGIVYTDDRFYYHAWAESYVGQWVAFDPTLYEPERPIDFVDATHIKFAQGDVTDMFEVIPLIGKLRVTVEEVAH